MIRLGVATAILGRSIGGRTITWPERHLSRWLVGVQEALHYLIRHDITFYRLGFGWGAGAELAAFRRELQECAAVFRELGVLLRTHCIRLAVHAGMGVAPGNSASDVRARGNKELIACAELLDAFGAGPESRVCVHIGGAAEEREAALLHCVEQVRVLPAHVRARLAFEPDESCFGLGDVLRVAQATGVPVIFDSLHFLLNNPEQLSLSLALGLAFSTWPVGQRPEIHFSSARTEAHRLPERAGLPGRVVAPRHGQHADFINAHEFAALLEAAHGFGAFDVMLEAKAADLALLRLRDDLERAKPKAVCV